MLLVGQLATIPFTCIQAVGCWMSVVVDCYWSLLNVVAGFYLLWFVFADYCWLLSVVAGCCLLSQVVASC